MRFRVITWALLLFATASFAQSPAKGHVVFYRLKFAVISSPLDSAAVWVDGKKTAILHAHRSLTIELEPGKHEFRSDSKDSPVIIDVKPGSVYYLRQEYDSGNMSMTGTKILVAVSAEAGEAQIRKTKPAPASEVIDSEFATGGEK